MVFPHDSRWLGWLVRHACWLLNRVTKKQSNKRTRFEDCFQREPREIKFYEPLSPVAIVPHTKKEVENTSNILEDQWKEVCIWVVPMNATRITYFWRMDV